MKRLGKFTMYQDPKTNSAAVYFHRRRQFVMNWLKKS